MFELYQFFPLLEPAWLADPNKTAEVIGGLIEQAKTKNLQVAASILEHALLQLAEGRSLAVIGGAPMEEVLVPQPPAPPPLLPPATSGVGSSRQHKKR